MEKAEERVRVRPTTIKRLNRERKTFKGKVSNDFIINDALDFKKKYRKVVE